MGGTALAVAGFVVRPGPYNNWIDLGIVYENPLGIDAASNMSPAIIAVGTIVALVSALSSVVAVRQRFKQSTGEERQRMRVLAFVASIAGTLFVLAMDRSDSASSCSRAARTRTRRSSRSSSG